MNDEQAFHRAMLETPEDNSLRLVFADWLEERNDPRAELIRLLHVLTQSIEVPGRQEKEERLRNLLASGVQPVGPFWTNSIGMKFAWIPAGTFLMGSPEGEAQRKGVHWDADDEETQHQVTLTSGFFLSVHEVAQEQWRALKFRNRSRFKGEPNLPVENVSWEDSHEFLQRMSEEDGLKYRLPSEAQWEFACRAGTTTPFHFGPTISTKQANFDGSIVYGKGKKGISRKQTTQLGMFPTNAFGLCDMHGNVWEWCSDWYEEYSAAATKDAEGPSSGEFRVVRGGCYNYSSNSARSAHRGSSSPANRDSETGFRPALSSKSLSATT